MEITFDVMLFYAHSNCMRNDLNVALTIASWWTGKTRFAII